MARGPLRAKISKLQEALGGHVEDHHGFIGQLLLERIDQLTTNTEELRCRIDLVIAPFRPQLTQLAEVSGIGQVAAQARSAELGVDMAVSPSAAHLVSWAKSAPQARQSAGKAKRAATGQAPRGWAPPSARSSRLPAAPPPSPPPALGAWSSIAARAAPSSPSATRS